MIIYNSVVRKTFGLISFFVFPFSVFAQQWEVGAGAGVCHYKGDIMPTFKPFVFSPGASTFVRYNWSRSVSLKVQGMYGGIRGYDKNISDPYHQARAHSFKTTLLEGIGQVEYNFANFRTTASRIVNNWTPYVFGGYGGAMAHTKAQLASINNNVYITRSSPSFVALGIGFKKEWRNQWNWGVEFGTRWTDTDYLDNKGYARDGSVQVPTSSTASTTGIVFPYYFQKYQTPGTKVKDIYYYTNFSISYVFYKVHCPTRR